MKAPLDWMKSVQWLANAGHFLAGFGITLITAFWTFLTGASLLPLYVVTAILVVVIGFKEAYLDPKYETGENLVTGFYDWLGWMLGSGVAWANVLAALWTHHWIKG